MTDWQCTTKIQYECPLEEFMGICTTSGSCLPQTFLTFGTNYNLTVVHRMFHCAQP